MALYINGIGCISPQRTFDNSVFLDEVVVHTNNRLVCIDPDYTGFFDTGSIRRMGRLMKYGTAAGLIALQDSGVKIPGAITTGTGLGLPEISQKFLKSLIEAEETIVSPTAFIQSTHNTVSSNIALLCGCHAHNNTFSHKGFSFESALTDALMLAEEDADNILVGAYDEVSDYKYAASKKVQELRAEPCVSSQIFSGTESGILAGEGAAFFVLSKTGGEKSYGQFIANKTFYRPNSAEEIQSQIAAFVTQNDLLVSDIDVLISGLSGEGKSDAILSEVTSRMFTEQTIVAYKHLCGEYMTSSAFAFWLAAQMMKWQKIPAEVILADRNRKPRTVLLYNSYKANHSLMLFKNV